VNQNGAASPLPAPSGSTGWATEESLDVDMVSAICPKCHIYLVEATGPSTANLGTGVDSAVKVLKVKFVSNSYGGKDTAKDATYDTRYYKHPGVAVTASAGDSGYLVSYPAASQFVTAVGGTDLTKATKTTRGWTETVWSGSGSGCSKYEAKPSWQTDKGCSKRTDNDVAADADPGTGVAIYDTYDQGGWLQVGGTSVASPIIASVFALAGKPAKGTYPSSYPYAHTSDLNDVTSGNNGTCTPAYLCTGEVGYDGPTGWGTPNGLGAFTS
jgi:subtilase family serine protease